MGALTLVLVIACRCAPQALLAHGVWGARARPLGIGLLPQACMHACTRALWSELPALQAPTAHQTAPASHAGVQPGPRVGARVCGYAGCLGVKLGCHARGLHGCAPQRRPGHAGHRVHAGVQGDGRAPCTRCYPTCCPTASAAWETGGSCFSPTLSVLTSCAPLPPTPLPPPWLQILTSNAPGAQATAVQRATAKATMLGSVALSLAMHKLMPGVYRAPVYLLDGLRDARVP